jgi:hypothetical protein
MSTMKVQTILVTVLAAMLAVTSCLAATQADYLARVKANPTEDYSGLPSYELDKLADADALVYFQGHNDLRGGYSDLLDIGKVHSLKHQLLGGIAFTYALSFSLTLKALLKE